MAVLHGVTVKIVSKSTRDGPREFTLPNNSLAASDTTLERYIEEWPGMDFQIEVYFSREFNSEIGWGVAVGIKLNGGDSFGHCWTKSQINRFQMSGSGIVFDGVEKSPVERVAFRFGSMNQNIDQALGEPNGHSINLGTMEVEILRIRTKRNLLHSEVPPKPVETTPRRTLDLSGRDITDTNFANTIWQKKRKTPPFLNPLAFMYGTDEKLEPARLSFLYRHGLAPQLQALGCVPSVPPEAPMIIPANSGQYTYTSKDFRLLAEKVERLEEQLRESQQQTAALIQHLVGGIHHTIANALGAPHNGIVSTPAQNSGVKRKRKTDEVTPVVENRPVDPNSRNYYGD